MGCQGLEKKKWQGTLAGLGTFKKVCRKIRKGRDLQTGEHSEIKGKNVIIFKTGKEVEIKFKLSKIKWAVNRVRRNSD